VNDDTYRYQSPTACQSTAVVPPILRNELQQQSTVLQQTQESLDASTHANAKSQTALKQAQAETQHGMRASTDSNGRFTKSPARVSSGKSANHRAHCYNCNEMHSKTNPLLFKPTLCKLQLNATSYKANATNPCSALHDDGKSRAPRASGVIATATTTSGQRIITNGEEWR